ncbi:N-alpha-acetyltransferase 25, NatB auxiliary subunit [Protopterus annectens]|uniref:N-alpha-acetyltransferase 25, NatB auxiliary subunit n=1 Tax=Protopterus annectens TaxID=7888 RepID=UPI001CFAB4EB|nr:N-alpha-acetyltransferase 25, NatB auxiliary subunit [Protopterus annectens]
MAARSHVQDPNDRRLRPIYDSLDNGNNKMAIQQADKLLKKHKDLHCAKMLHEQQSQDMAMVVINPGNPINLDFRVCFETELVTKLYEAAVKKVPSSEEYHSHLFMAYARVGEYKKMQQAGMALYKIVPKNPYYFWSVMSLVMQSISAQDEKLSKTMFLPLAERMVEKMVKEDKIEAEAEVQLYYMILERLGKFQEALNVLRGNLGEKLTSELQSRESKCLAMYKKLRKWQECNALSRKLLLNNPDDWQFYLSYFDSLFHLVDEGWIPPEGSDHSVEGVVDYSVEEAAKFIEDRIINEESKGFRKLRGPYLAKLELIQRLRQRGANDEHKLGEPVELMIQYFEKFGDKPCCYTDLKVFVDLLSPDQHIQFINKLMEAVPLMVPADGGFALPGDTKVMYRHMCVVQLSRLLCLHHNKDQSEKLNLIGELMSRYRHGLEFGKSCLKTELQSCDNYCLLAAHVFIDIWKDTGDEWPLWQSMYVLEEGLFHSPCNAQFKLLLTRIFCHLGAFEPVVDLYSSLDAKHVQHDTIGYLLTRYAEALGQFAAASQSCNFTLRFFHSNQKDTSEYIIQAYKYGAFEKIPEFIAFRNRLNNSLHFAQVRTERMLLDLFLEANISVSLEESIKSMSLNPEDDDIPWNDLRDNRDINVLTNWDPKDRGINENDLILLNKGLGFIPSQSSKLNNTLTELRLFARLVALKLYFNSNAKSIETISNISLKKKSNFTPPLPSNVECFTRICEDDFYKYYTQNNEHNVKKNRYYNMTSFEVASLAKLTQDDMLTIKPADKGGAIILMDTTEYDKSMHTLLNDTKTYIVITTTEISRIIQKVHDNIYDLLMCRQVDKELYEFLLIDLPLIPSMKGLPKYPFLALPSSRMAGYFSTGTCHCQMSCFHLVCDIYDLDTSGMEETVEIQERIRDNFASLLLQLKELFSCCKGNLMEVKNSQCKTNPAVLENLVFFVETISIVLWTSSYCASVLRPLKSNLQKKKKKKKEASVVLPPAFTNYQDYVTGLHSLLGEALEHIKGVDATLTALKLEELFLEDTALSEVEKKFTKTVQGKVQSSYQRSLQEIEELLKKRLDTVKVLKI